MSSTSTYVPPVSKTVLGFLIRFDAHPIHVYAGGDTKPGNGVSGVALLRMLRDDLVVLVPAADPAMGKRIRLTDTGDRVLAMKLAESAPPR